ncbi:D-ribose transporter ATP-binding protein [Devosia epidermidihirudinis]|uniref:D-ribose transporter ATP-binding protein n=1 Tax=Devosia epidermidihirudinis TaxID=1293439 RepID=A0A0F5Q983_9HYPH|nr:sugar ABC transporter ATP-binding protein [Devosia epidermidihirudinis]KKC37271.1 D-ribose transporter ATP-binding protein [Devosia epidermidihirudinis]
MHAPLLKVENLTRMFPGVIALGGVDLEVPEGEIHALLGENGAGKSTLLKILSGAQSASSGAITFAGESYEPSSPIAAQRAGIVTIYQEFSLIPDITVAENIFLGRQPLRNGVVDWDRMIQLAGDICRRVGRTLDPRAIVRDLSVGDQQLVEISRALSMDARLIIMDEPTAALSGPEVTRLLELMRALRADGVTIIFVSHRLSEVMDVCDSYTVLRDGRLVGAGRVADTSVARLVASIVGRESAPTFKRAARKADAASPLLRVENLSYAGHGADAISLHDINLEVRRGEVLGIAGLVGAGRTQLARLIFGAELPSRGTIKLDGHATTIASPRDAIAAGIGLVPEDRKQQALFLDLSSSTNLSVTTLSGLTGWFGWVRERQEKRLFQDFRKKLAIKVSSSDQLVGNLSGGNQQKIILARWLALKPRLLIVDEPTRGVDVGAKAEIHALLCAIADEGVSVIVISSELPEILAVSDRIVVMCEGRVTGELEGEAANETNVARLMLPGATH